jgi:hypothetical protein
LALELVHHNVNQLRGRHLQQGWIQFCGSREICGFQKLVRGLRERSRCGERFHWRDVRAQLSIRSELRRIASTGG